MHPKYSPFTDSAQGVREYLISPLFVSTFNANQYIRQRHIQSTGASVSEEPLPPPTFGEMRFARVPDTATSGAIAGALLMSWKCKPLPRSEAPSLPLRFLTSWIPPCPSRSGHLGSFLCHPPTAWERIQCTAGKICLEEADVVESDNPRDRKFTFGILGATPIQVNWFPARRSR